MDRQISNRSTAEDTQHPITPEKETKRKRKSMGLDEPYEHAPPKPDGDPWAILLKPELEADKIRCDAWKEEVSNLLIFAGLFSAVVTAFVIESYKFLQPDPNDAIISLLSQIANGPNNASSLLLYTRSSTPMITPFEPTPSSVRINVFWFISLILSLATVLVGTIALQWLREHQSYHGFSPKETLAILHMRSKSLEAWYVPQIFSTLPLLLQGALVLFFAGLIDFTLPLGTKLTAPIACFIALILLFLAATTALPAFQPLFLLSGHFSRDMVPTPCAFKSPQSQVFRTLSGFFLRLLSFVFPKIYVSQKQFKFNTWNILTDNVVQRHLFPYIYTIWHRKTWPTADFEWLSLRDAWHNNILDKDIDLYEHRKAWKGAFPLSDITQCLGKTAIEPTSAKHTEDFLVAACYCFEEISASVWITRTPNNDRYDRVDRRNNYFEQLYQRQDWFTACSVSKFLIHGGTYEYNRFPDYFLVSSYVREHHDLFHQDQVLLFFSMLLQHRTSPALERYQLEIESRKLQYLLKRNVIPLTPMTNILYNFKFSYIHHVIGSYTNPQRTYINASDLVDLLAKIFQNVAVALTNVQDQSINPLYTHRSMHMILDMLATGIISHMQSMTKPDPDTSNREYLQDISDEYISTFRLIANHLNNEISKSDTTTPSLLFYLSAIFLHYLLHGMIQTAEPLTIPEGKDSSFSRALTVLLDTLVLYKEKVTGRSNAIEIRLGGFNYTRVGDAGRKFEHTGTFSDQWWTGFFLAYDDSGLRDTKKGLTASSSTLHNTSPPLLPSAPDEPHIPVLDIKLLSPSAGPLHIHSGSITKLVISSAPTSDPDAATISNTTSDVFPLEQVAEHPAGDNARQSSLSSPAMTASTEHADADVQLLSISPMSPDIANESSVKSSGQGIPPQIPSPGVLIRDDNPPRNQSIPGDSSH